MKHCGNQAKRCNSFEYDFPKKNTSKENIQFLARLCPFEGTEGRESKPECIVTDRPILAERLIMAPFASGLTRTIVGPSDLFSKRSWPLAQVLLVGAILAVGPRTISAVLWVMGLSEDRQFQKYHRVLNRVKWSTLAASRTLLKLLIEAFAPEGPLLMALDDTIERRRGAKIAAKGIYRDPVRSSHGHFVKASGLRWLCLRLVAPIPWAKRCWALLFCSVLAPSKRYYLKRGGVPTSSPTAPGNCC
jgi:hypothetical protein